MAKSSQRRPVRHEKEHLGCMGGLISIFDFRHGRTTQRLLSDRRRPNIHANGNSRNRLDMSTLDENHQVTSVGEENQNGTAAPAKGKPSVKKLIEEEMINEVDTKKDMSSAEIESKSSVTEQGGHKKKNRRRAKKSRKKSCDSFQDMDDTENTKFENPSDHNQEHQYAANFDMDNLMDEFCHHIHQRSICKEMNDEHAELPDQLNKNNPNFEEKLREAIKLLVTEKLVKGKHLKEDDFSKELMDALENLGSDGELLVKELQDPNSLLMKCFKNSDYNEESKTQVGTNLSDQEIGNLGQSENRCRNFFKRMVKSQEKSRSTESKTAQASKRIVILKPGPTSLQNTNKSSIPASSKSHLVVRDRGPNDKMSSHFFFTEIKRKLKNAMGKEHQKIGSDRILGEREKGIRENIGLNSPTKDHFFIEKAARRVGVKKRFNKPSEVEESATSMEHKISDLPKEKVSNIYIEAKKHLSEILSNEDENPDSSNRHVPRSLGRILSLPEYNFSPLGSPGRNWENSSVTAQMRFSDAEKYQMVYDNMASPKQGGLVFNAGQTTQNSETQPSFSDDNKDNNPKLTSDNKVEETFATAEEINDKGDLEITEGSAIIVEIENNALDNSHEISINLGIEEDDLIGEDSEIHDEQECSTSTKEELYEENELPSSPTTSPSNSSLTKKVPCQGRVIDAAERGSPVSVLEPLFVDDDISPARTRSHSVDASIQPLRIQFEEDDSSTAVQDIQTKSSKEEKELVFDYVKAVLQTSSFNWHELCEISLSTDELLDPSLCNEVEFFQTQLCCEKKLLFDCINEVLVEVCGRYFGCSPWLKFTIRPIPNMETAISEVYEGVLWHLIPLPLPHTLDQIVRKDMVKSGTWMDLQFDVDVIGTEMGEIILEELMEDTIFSCVNENVELEESKSRIIDLEIECPALSVELEGSETSIDL